MATSNLPTIDELPDSLPIYIISKATDAFQTFKDEGDHIVFTHRDRTWDDKINFSPSFKGLRERYNPEDKDVDDFKVKMALFTMPVKQQLTEEELETVLPDGDTE